MTGAILKREIVVPGRKLHTFLVRGGYSLILAASFAIIFLYHLVSLSATAQAGASIRQVTDTGQRLFGTFVTINMLACLVFTPAYVAGAISQEKDQRTMQDLLLTTMSAIEIVISKLFGRLAQVLLVLAAGLPLVSIGSLLGGVSGSMLLATAVTTLLWLITTGAFALLISVLVRRMRDAILGSYALGAMLLVGMSTIRYFVPIASPWLNSALDAFNPFAIVADAWSGVEPTALWVIIAETSLVLGIFSASAILLTIVLLRPLGTRQLEVKSSRRGWRLRRRVGRLSEERPMLWKEQCFPPSGRITTLSHLLGILATLTMLVMLAIWIWIWFNTGFASGVFFEDEIWFGVAKLLAWPVYLSLLLTSSSAFAGERERATWDALLTSPLEGGEIVGGKLVGSLWEVRWWLAAIALSLVQVAFYALSNNQTFLPLGSTSVVQPGPWKLVRVLGMIVTGTFGGAPGLVGLAGEILYILGLGLTTSLRSKTSGRSLGMALGIWIASGIVFWIVLYLGLGMVALIFFALARGQSANWLVALVTPIGPHLLWLGPMVIGLFWGAVGVWLIRRTIVQFDDVASRMKTREVLRLEGLPAAVAAEGTTGMAVQSLEGCGD